MSSTDSHAAGGNHHGDHEHPPFLAHHWSTPEQQFEAGKLGMWLFLATEFLLFGGLFAAYAVLRSTQEGLFEYGSQFLNTKMGAINTVVLILSSLTMALAVSAAQLGKQRALVTLLSLTFLGGAGFMVIKYFEYKEKFEKNVVWGTGLYEPVKSGRYATPAAVVVPAANTVADDAPAFDVNANGGAAAVDAPMLPRSSVQRAPSGPRGMDVDRVEEVVAESRQLGIIVPPHTGKAPDPRIDPNRPQNAHLFFGIYFLMTGLHGFHVVAGMVVIAWLIWRSVRGDFGPQYFTPVDLGGLYWHVVDLIWIFLFPLMYLI